jgi:hypothetical protein
VRAATGRARTAALAIRLVAALQLAGCAGCAPAFVAQRPYPGPSPEDLLAGLRARQQAVRAADLETRTTSAIGGERARATVLMLVDRPGRLRFDVEVALHGAVASLATDGDSFAMLDLQGHVFRQGGACPENLALLVPVRLRPAEIAAVLLGDVPLVPEARAVGLTWDGKARVDVLEIQNPGGRTLAERVWVSLRRTEEGKRWDVVGLEARPLPGTGRWRVAYEDLRAEGAWSFPGVIRFAEPGRRFEDGVEIVVKGRRLNPELRPQAFTLTAPEGYHVLSHPCPSGAPAGS